jgi:hypothetical protein
VRPLAVAMEQRHPLLPDVPTFKELGVDWVDGAYRGIGVPKAPRPSRARGSPTCSPRSTPTGDEGAGGQGGFELVSVGVDGMDAFMKTRTRVYVDVGKRMGLGGAK